MATQVIFSLELDNAGKVINSQKELTEEIKKTNEAISDLKQNDKRLEPLKTKITQLTAAKKSFKDEIRLASKEIIEQGKESTKTYRGMAASLNNARKKYKDLVIAGNQFSKHGRDLKKQIDSWDKSLKKADASVGQFNRSIGNYGRRMQGLSRQMLSAAGIVGAGAVLVSVFNSAKDIVVKFDKAQADLAGVLKTTRGSIKALTDQAQALGATTLYSANQVSELHIELAKLGFKEKEIVGMTKAIIDLSVALDVDAGEAAKLTGAAMRAFGVETEEISKVVATLAISTTNSALTFEKLKVSMGKVAPIAAGMGLQLEDTVAMLGILANQGFDASTATTSLRNILLKVADPAKELNQRLKGNISTLDLIIAGFKGLSIEGLDVAKALKLTDVRASSAFLALAEGADDVYQLRNSLLNAEKALQDLVDLKLDTLTGQFTLLQSAWEGFVLALDDGTGRLSGFAKAFAKLGQEILQSGTLLAEYDWETLENFNERYGFEGRIEQHQKIITGEAALIADIKENLKEARKVGGTEVRVALAGSDLRLSEIDFLVELVEKYYALGVSADAAKKKVELLRKVIATLPAELDREEEIKAKRMEELAEKAAEAAAKRIAAERARALKSFNELRRKATEETTHFFDIEEIKKVLAVMEQIATDPSIDTYGLKQAKEELKKFMKDWEKAQEDRLEINARVAARELELKRLNEKFGEDDKLKTQSVTPGVDAREGGGAGLISTDAEFEGVLADRMSLFIDFQDSLLQQFKDGELGLRGFLDASANLAIEKEIARLERKLATWQLEADERYQIEVELAEKIAALDKQKRDQKKKTEKDITDNIKKEADARKKYEEDLAKAIGGIAEDLGDVFADHLEDREKSNKEFQKEMLKTLVDATLRVVRIMAIEAVVRALGRESFAGIVTGSIVAGLITAAGGGLKGIIAGFAEGGYTGSGGAAPRDHTGHIPVGVVHNDEYVVPKRVLGTSGGRELVDRLEQMRVGGGMRNGYSGFYADGGFVSSLANTNIGTLLSANTTELSNEANLTIADAVAAGIEKGLEKQTRMMATIMQETLRSERRLELNSKI